MDEGDADTDTTLDSEHLAFTSPNAASETHIAQTIAVPQLVPNTGCATRAHEVRTVIAALGSPGIFARHCRLGRRPSWAVLFLGEAP